MIVFWKLLPMIGIERLLPVCLASFPQPDWLLQSLTLHSASCAVVTGPFRKALSTPPTRDGEMRNCLTESLIEVQNPEWRFDSILRESHLTQWLRLPALSFRARLPRT
jgi:hypothetical protein